MKPWWHASDQERHRSTIRVLRDIQNKHIADVYDLADFASGQRLAIVEERLEGPSLIEWESGKRPSEQEVLRTLLQMAGALWGLHSHDLSPPSLDAGLWRFDSEGLLNLSVFILPSTNGTHPDAPTPLTAKRAAADELGLATHAKRIATQHLTGRGVAAPVLSDPVLSNLWNGIPGPVSDLYHRLQACLLRDQHRAVVIYRGHSVELNANKRNLKFVHPTPSVAEVSIHYNGIEFVLNGSVNEVFLNNAPVVPPAPLPSSCVITLGSPSRPWNERHFITFDASHPEVVL